MPVFNKAMASKKFRKDRVRRDADDDDGPVAKEGEDLLAVADAQDSDDDDEEESEIGSLPDEVDFSDDEEEEEADDEDEDGDSGDDDGEGGPSPRDDDEDDDDDDEARKAVTVEFSEPKKWVERMTLSAAKPLPADLDPNDDPKREEVFMHHAVLSARRGIAMLERAGVKWRRPEDYYAEMYKTDMQMEKIKASMERARKEVQERAHRRNMREQRKFGKEVQADVLRQRAQAKNAQLAKLTEWRKGKGRKGGASLDDVVDGDDDGGSGKGGKGQRDKFRKPGMGGAARRGGGRQGGGAKKSLRPGAAGKKRPGKARRR